jgi:outer membrane phospholipase A
MAFTMAVCEPLRTIPLRSGCLALLTAAALFASSESRSADNASFSSSEAELSALAVPLEACLLAQALLEANNSLTVAEVRAACMAQIAALANTAGSQTASSEAAGSETSGSGIAGIENISMPSATARSFVYEADSQRFFRPYKNNYLVFGGMKNHDDTPAFSGNNLDIKFELGMMFSLIPSSGSESGFIPLHIGYSQRSWWDISEPSAPFQEHNYNPEIFWDFTRSTRNTNSLLTNLRNLFFIDRIGVEHQSNGLNEERSRSWDRAYLEREFVFSEALSFNLKLWHVLNQGLYNEDITDFLGDAQLTTHINLNNMFDIDIKTMKGHETGKISYQVDLTLPMSQWVSSKLFLSYYDGYGEALINYNKRSKSLRAGFYFPLRLMWM